MTVTGPVDVWKYRCTRPPERTHRRVIKPNAVGGSSEWIEPAERQMVYPWRTVGIEVAEPFQPFPVASKVCGGLPEASGRRNVR